MKTYLGTIAATLALAVCYVASADQPALAAAPRTLQAADVASDDAAAPQPQPYVSPSPTYGPYAQPNGSAPMMGGPMMGPYGPMMGPGGCGPAMGPYGCGPEGPSHPALSPMGLMRAAEWRFAVDTFFMQRSSPGAQTLLRNGFGTTALQVFNARDFRFGTGTGVSVSAVRAGGFGLDTELRYTHDNSLKAARVFAGNVFLDTDANGANFTVLNPTIENTSEFHSGEVNLWLHRGQRVRWMSGFRWMEWNDRYLAEATGANFNVPVTLENLAFNSLYGAQIGGDIKVIDWGRLTINWGTKVGGYGNNASQRSHQVDTGFTDQTLASHGPRTSFSCEMEAMATVELIFSRLYFRAGYELLYLDGILLAPDQIAVNDFSRNTAGLRWGSILSNNAYAGFELRF